MPASTPNPSSAGAFRHYWVQSARPLMSLVFVAPMIILYESGLLLLGPQAMRNGVDVWLRDLLDHLGFSQYLLLPCLTCASLLGWHHLKKETWQLCWTALYGMLLEAMLFGFLLLLLIHLHAAAWPLLQVEAPSVMLSVVPAAGQVLGFLGAGIYEELLFRLMLLPPLATLLRWSGMSTRVSWGVAILLSSLAFAAAHYQLDLVFGSLHLRTSFGEPFQWTSFCYRFGAGIFFAALFLRRGFGIVAGAHAFYDILATMT